MHAQQTLYNPQAHKQIRAVVGGGNVYSYVPGTNSVPELNFKEGIVAKLFEDPKVIDPATQRKMGESFKKGAGFRMPKELRLSTFEKEQGTKGTGGLWDQYVAWGEELKKATANVNIEEAKTYLTQLKNAKNNSEVAQIKQVVKIDNSDKLYKIIADIGKSKIQIVSGISNATKITNGYRHACAILDNKSVQCWGRNNQGQLGDGTFVDRNVPTAVTGVMNVVEIAPGYRHTCALLDNNTIQCWGQNNYGQLGDGTIINRTTPAEVQF